MKALDELRRCFGADCMDDESVCKQYHNCKEHYLSLIDAAESEVAERYVALPVDADGEVIRNDVTLVGSCGQTHVVDVLELHGSGEWTAAEYSTSTHVSRLDGWRIYHAPTVEDVLREFAAEFVGCANYVDDHEVTDAIAEYATKLQLKEDE